MKLPPGLGPDSDRGQEPLPEGRVVVGWAVVALVVVGMAVYSITATEQLLLGWLYFPLRVVPRAKVDWPAVALGAACAVAFVLGLHMVVRRFVLGPSGGTPDDSFRWTFRLTLLLSATLLVTFAAGTAMVGATHQFIWVVSGAPPRSEEPERIIGAAAEAQRWAAISKQKHAAHEIAISSHNFAESHGSLPPGGTMDIRGRLLHGWGLYTIMHGWAYAPDIDYSVPWDEPPNDRVYRGALPIYLNPAIEETFDERGFALSHFAANVRVLPVVRLSDEALTKGIREVKWQEGDIVGPSRPFRLKDVKDGLSNTLLVGEVGAGFLPWGHPANVRDPALGLGTSAKQFGGSPGAEKTQFVMCDGVTRYISNDIDPRVLRMIATPAGGEDVRDEY